MGVATGSVPVGTPMLGSAVYDQAKLVSDAARGGQVLLCAETYQAVKDLGRELGHVTSDGPQFVQSSFSWWR